LDENQKMPWWGGKAGFNWALENVRGKYLNRQTGLEFEVTRGTLKHSVVHAHYKGEKIRILEALPQIIEYAHTFFPEKPYIGKQRNVVTDQFFYAPVEVDGRMRVARLVVHRKELPQGVKREVYDVKSVETREARLSLSLVPASKETGGPGMLRFEKNIEQFRDLVKQTWPKD